MIDVRRDPNTEVRVPDGEHPHGICRNQEGDLVISAGFGLSQIFFILDADAEADLRKQTR